MKVYTSRRQIVGFRPISFDLAQYCRELMVCQSLTMTYIEVLIWPLGKKGTKESQNCFFSHYTHNDLTEKT